MQNKSMDMHITSVVYGSVEGVGFLFGFSSDFLKICRVIFSPSLRSLVWKYCYFTTNNRYALGKAYGKGNGL